MTTYLQTLLDAVKQNVSALEDELRHHGQDLANHWQLDAVSARDDTAYVPSHKELALVEKVQTDLRAVKDILTPTPHKLLHLAMGNLKTQALNTVIELRVADAIRDLGGHATSEQLASHVGANETKLLRVLGILTVDNVFRETAPGVFANNRHSLGLLADKAPGATAMLSLTAFENANAAFALTSWASNPEAKDDFSPDKAPFTLRNGVKFYDYVTQPQAEKTLQKLIGGVVPWLNQITRPALLNDYPWDALSPATTVVDLGCASGDVGLDVLKQYPNLRWDFQDLAPVVDQTRASLTPQLDTLGLLPRATFTAQDYFQPNVRAGQANLVFFMRGVPRDYGDPEVRTLFRATADSMRACPDEATLLINEIVCPSAAVIAAGEERKVLPSERVPVDTQSSILETANVMALSATSFLNGAERTYEQYARLLDEAGLYIVKLHKLRTFTSIMECRIKDA